MSQVSAVETIGTNKIRLKLKAPSGQMPYLLGGQAGMMIGPAALADNAFGAMLKPVGVGPYRVRSFESNIQTLTTRYDTYWEGTEGRPASFEHHFASDAEHG